MRMENDDTGTAPAPWPEEAFRRKVRTLFRLTPLVRPPVSGKFHEAIVAAATEDEARALAFLHDPSGREWHDHNYAACCRIDAIGEHFHADGVFISFDEGACRTGSRQHAAR